FPWKRPGGGSPAHRAPHTREIAADVVESITTTRSKAMPGKVTVKLRDIKPDPDWDVNHARDRLIKMAEALQREGANQNAVVDVKAVKCAAKGGEVIEYEWSGAAAANDVKRVVKL